MSAEPFELEGTWEEIAAHAGELTGRQVRLSVLPNEVPSAVGTRRRSKNPSTARSLLDFAEQWSGDDLEECLRAVHAARLPAQF